MDRHDEQPRPVEAASGGQPDGGAMATAGILARARLGEASPAEAARRLAPLAWLAARLVTGDDNEAERIAAEVLAGALEGTLQPPASAASEPAWTVATARAHALASVNRPRRLFRRSQASAVPASLAPVPDGIDGAAMHAAFAGLPLLARNALGLAYGPGLALPEVGRRLGLETAEARALLRDGLLTLEARIAGGQP
jgi:DNA-directed RNA polymerase specialized sigma24 family protein